MVKLGFDQQRPGHGLPVLLSECNYLSNSWKKRHKSACRDSRDSRLADIFSSCRLGRRSTKETTAWLPSKDLMNVAKKRRKGSRSTGIQSDHMSKAKKSWVSKAWPPEPRENHCLLCPNLLYKNKLRVFKWKNDLQPCWKNLRSTLLFGSWSLKYLLAGPPQGRLASCWWGICVLCLEFIKLYPVGDQCHWAESKHVLLCIQDSLGCTNAEANAEGESGYRQPTA